MVGFFAHILNIRGDKVQQNRLRSLNNNNKLPKYSRVSNRGTVCPSKVFTLSKLATDSVGPLFEFFFNDHVKVGLVEIVQNSDWHHF